MIRYGTVASTFWAVDRETRGLPMMAALLLLRARSASLVGVLQLSPRMMVAAHCDATVDGVMAAIGELERRGLAKWWPEHETLALFAHAATAQGSAAGAADKLLAGLPPEIAAFSRGQHPRSDGGSEGTAIPPSEGGSNGGPDPSEPDPVPHPDPQPDPQGSLTRSPRVRAARSVKRSAKDPQRVAEAERERERKLAELVRRHGTAAVDVVQQALDRLTELRRELIGPRCAALTAVDDGAHMLKRVASGVTLDQLLLVCESEAAKVRAGGTADYFDAVTPFRDSQWPQRRAQAETWDARRRKAQPRAPEPPSYMAPERPEPASPDEIRDLLPPWAQGVDADPFEGDDGP